MRAKLNPLRSLAALAILGWCAGSAAAAVIIDPANDFLSTFPGPFNGDLDVLKAEVFFDGTNFFFTSTQNGAIGTTPGALFVWGVDRGSGTPRFGAFRPGVLFDSVVVIAPGGVSTVRDFITGSVTNLPPAAITFSGNNIQALVSKMVLPTEGVDFSQFTVNLWPRTGLASTSQIADFAPDNNNAAITLVKTIPEPNTFTFAGAAVLALFLARRRAA